MKMCFKLIGVDNDHPVTKSTDGSFLLLIQQAALLGLKDAGRLNEMQYRQAEETLLQQYREDVRIIGTEGSEDD